MALEPIESLPIQQRKTLEYLAEGVGNVQIAQRYRVALESVTGMLSGLYTALGIDESLSRQEKRTMAIDHFKKSTGALPIFEQKTPAALLEGLKPWQRKALNLIAQGKRNEEVAAEVGFSVTVVEETFVQFMKSVNMPTRDHTIAILKQVVSAISEPMVSERGYANGHDKTTVVSKESAKSEAPSPPLPEKLGGIVEPRQDSTPAPIVTTHQVLSVPVSKPATLISPTVQTNGESQMRTEKPISLLATTATKERLMLDADRTTTAQTSEGLRPISDRITAYIDLHKISIKEFARRTNSSVSTIYKIKKGEKVWKNSIERIEAALAGKISPEAGGDNSISNRFDATCEKFIVMVTTLALGQHELDELVRLVFVRWHKSKGVAEAEKFAIDLLRQYLTTEGDESRLDMLLELRDLMKENGQKKVG